MFAALRTLPFRSARMAALALTAAFAVACGDDDPTDIDDEPNVATMRITVGSQTIDVNAGNGTVTGGPITIGTGTTTFSVQFLLANGQPDPIVTAANFEVRVTSTNTARVTVAKTGAFSGTLTRISAGTANIDFQLYHLGDQHGEFNWPVPITVQ